MRRPMAELGVYIHYPWCRSLCPYCDFPRQQGGEDRAEQEAYLDAIVAELGDRMVELGDRQLVSIYFGGGSPSLWAPRLVGAVIAAVAEGFAVATLTDLEITLEANPRDCSAERLAAWAEVGVNRLSIGTQGFVAGDLLTLGRDHDVAAAVLAVDRARAAGFTSLSADVIIGVPRPGRSSTPAEPSVGAAADLGLPHLSVYELTYKEGTALARAVAEQRLAPVDEEVLSATFVAVHELLLGRGYEHYEISSYARPGQRAVHNSLYWQGAEFLGLGAGAASFIRAGEGGARTTNIADPAGYMAARGSARVADTDELDADELAVDRLWLAMRTSDGAPESWFAGREAVVDELIVSRLAVREGERIQPTMRGFLFADTVARSIVGARRYTSIRP